MAATLGHVEPFDLSENWSLYTERLGQFFVANEIKDDAKQVAVLLTVIGSKPYELLHSLLAPAVPASKKYAELVAVLGDHLNPKPLVIAEIFKFHHRNQREGETVAQYMAALRKLTERCEFKDYLEEALRDRLVCGLRSEAVQRRLLSEKDLKLQTAYDVAVSMEAANRQASELQSPGRTPGHPYKAVGRVAAGKPSSVSPPISGSPPQSCYRCGKVGHLPDACFYKLQKCRNCGKKGHIAKVCRHRGEKGAFHGTARPNATQSQLHTSGRKPNQTSYVEQESSNEFPLAKVPELETGGLFAVCNTKRNPDSAIILEPVVNGVTLRMELDTGASVSLISEKVWREAFPEVELAKCDMLLKTYTGERLQVLGQMQAQVTYGEQKGCFPLLVVAGNGPSLWGRNWLTEIRLNWESVKRIRGGFEPLVEKYSEVFREELGTLKGVKVKLVVPEDATAKFFKPRPVPYAIRGAIEKDLERLENLGVIEKTNYSDWAAPIVVVPKSDGAVRICGDYKVTINPVLQVDQYPVPKADDLFATLAGGQKFSKLDLQYSSRGT